MRGRKPKALAIAAQDVAALRHIARCRTLPWFQVQRARILLAAAAAAPVGALAQSLQCDRTTIWRVRRRYRQRGLRATLTESPRSGKPLAISPPAARPDRTDGLP